MPSRTFRCQPFQAGGSRRRRSALQRATEGHHADVSVAPACSRLPLTPPGSPFARSKTKWQRSRRPAAFPSEKRTDSGFPFDRQRARDCRQAAVLAALATPLRRGGHDQRVRLQSEGEGGGRGGGSAVCGHRAQVSARRSLGASPRAVRREPGAISRDPLRSRASGK